MSITLDKICIPTGSEIQITDGTDTLSINADGSINATISGQLNVYAEDSAHVSGDDGNFVLAVRQDTKASTAGTDGDYAALIQDADGDLYVSDTVAQGSLSTLAGAIDGTEMQVDIVAPLPAGTNNIGDVDVLTMPGIYVEDAASAGGENLMLVGGYRQDADTSPVSADGDFHGFIFNSLGELKVSSKLDDTYNTSLTVTNASVDDTVGGTQLLGSAVSGRGEVTIQNLGDDAIYVKDGTGVTSGAAGNGFEIPACSSATFKWGDNIDPYAITVASGSANVKVIEAA